MQVALQKDKIGRMLERLGNAVSTGDLKGISSCYALPAMFVWDEGSRVVGSAEVVEQVFGEDSKWYIAEGILTTRGELLHFEPLTETVAAVDVRWPGFDEAGNENYSEIS